jgi:hypothetical protein
LLFIISLFMKSNCLIHNFFFWVRWMALSVNFCFWVDVVEFWCVEGILRR